MSDGDGRSSTIANHAQMPLAPSSQPAYAMASVSSTAVAAETDPVPVGEISVGQRMLSATSGSVLTSLLVTPLDVVRVRLQSQPQASSSATSLRASPLRLPNSPGSIADLGVRSCCREVFWVSNNTQYCFAASPSATINSSASTVGSLNSLAESTTTTAEHCAVENNRQRSFTSTYDGLRKIARNEGITTLWRGLSPTLLMTIPANVIYFTGYDWLRHNHTSPINRYVQDMYAPLAAGSVARVAAAMVVSPIEMFRTRMQASSGDSTTIFRDTIRGLGDVVRSQGYTSLWRGLTLTMWRDVPFSGLYWWGYEAVRNTITDTREKRRGRSVSEGDSRHAHRSHLRSQDNRKTTFVDSFLAGATSGAVASVVTTPFDVGKTRQQVFEYSSDSATSSSSSSSGKGASRAASAGPLPEERSMPRFLYHILRTEGVAGLFKGWVARCLKVAPACAIMISSYEVGKKMAQRSKDPALE